MLLVAPVLHFPVVVVDADRVLAGRGVLHGKGRAGERRGHGTSRKNDGRVSSPHKGDRLTLGYGLRPGVQHGGRAREGRRRSGFCGVGATKRRRSVATQMDGRGRL